MSLPEPQEKELQAALRRAYLLAYGLGLALCVVWPLALQALLERMIPLGFLGASPLAGELGYTFTGLVVLSALYVLRRSRLARSRFPGLKASRRPRTMILEILLYSALFEASALFGLVYYGLGGPLADRYARTFIALSTIMFFLFVPRWSAWRRALEPGATAP